MDDVADLLSKDEDIKALVAEKSRQLAEAKKQEARRAQADKEFEGKAETLREVLSARKVDSKRLQEALAEALEAERNRRA